MTGAVLGGVKGATVGTLEGAKEIVDAGADVAYSMTKEASKGGAEVARRVLRRPEEKA
jgi:hypothetical protein